MGLNAFFSYTVVWLHVYGEVRWRCLFPASCSPCLEPSSSIREWHSSNSAFPMSAARRRLLAGHLGLFCGADCQLKRRSRLCGRSPRDAWLALGESHSARPHTRCIGFAIIPSPFRISPGKPACEIGILGESRYQPDCRPEASASRHRLATTSLARPICNWISVAR